MVEKFRPTVVNIISERIKSGSQPHRREDPYRVGLVVEGGGMRGVISGGMVTALDALNAVSAFDGIYSNSSGSCAAAYLVSRQTPEGTSIYYQDINNRNFIDMWRLFQSRAIIDIPFLTHEVMRKRKPLEAGKIVDSPIPIHMYVTSAKNVETVDVHHFKTPDDVHDTLHWTCRIPVIAGMPIQVNGNYYADGGSLIGTIPIEEAVEDNCTHILALLTRPKGATKKINIIDLLIVAMLKRDFPELAEHFLDGYRKYNETLQRITLAQTDRLQDPIIEPVQLPPSQTMHTLETRQEKLVAGAKNGYGLVMEKFKSTPQETSQFAP